VTHGWSTEHLEALAREQDSLVTGSISGAPDEILAAAAEDEARQFQLAMDHHDRQMRRALGLSPDREQDSPGCSCNAAGSDDWRAHPEGCPRRRILYLATLPAAGRKHLEPAAVPEPSPDPAAEILAVLGEPIGLSGAQLPAYGEAEPGCCSSCLRGPLYDDARGPLFSGSGLCIYCHALANCLGSPRNSGSVPKLRLAGPTEPKAGRPATRPDPDAATWTQIMRASRSGKIHQAVSVLTYAVALATVLLIAAGSDTAAGILIVFLALMAVARR
jgi:hypothetical protein